MIGIYKITNKINGKCYIGQSVDIKRRWKDHRKDAFWKNSVDYEYPLYRAMRKYGIENFNFEIVEECSECQLNEKEIYYIALHKSNNREFGYNQNEGGKLNTHSFKLTDKEVDEIIHRLKTTMDGPKQISKEYGVGATTIHNINVGDAYRRDNETYPIRPRLYTIHVNQNGEFAQKLKEKHCKICGKPICNESTHCVSCMGIVNRKVQQRPAPLELAKMIKDIGFKATGQKFGVSDKTVVKWCRDYGMPQTKKEVVNWYYNKMHIEPTTKKIKKKISEIVRPINQICKTTGKILNTFSSQSEAMRSLGVFNRGNSITQVCRGIKQSAYGYYWQYAD